MLLALIVALAAAQDNTTDATDAPMGNETMTEGGGDAASPAPSSAGALRVAFALACSALMMLKL